MIKKQVMEQYISKSALVSELEKRIEETKSMQPKFDQFWAGQISAFKGVLKILNTLEVKEIDTIISDSRKANHAKFIKELKQKIDSYERELSKSSDSTKCDDVDWVMLASDMFDTLQKCLLNF